MNKKTILLDVDGVLLDWNAGFQTWLRKKNLQEDYFKHNSNREELVWKFNNSPDFEKLQPYSQMKHCVNILKLHGYKLHCITSSGFNSKLKERRNKNLQAKFGNAMSKITFLDLGEDKTEALKQYKDSGFYWIEDTFSWAEIGLRMGLKPLLIDHHYNREFENVRIPRIRYHAELIDIILNDMYYNMIFNNYFSEEKYKKHKETQL